MRDYFFQSLAGQVVPVASAPTRVIQAELDHGEGFDANPSPDGAPLPTKEQFHERCRIELIIREMEGRL